jgi:hypothetical protein
MVSVEACHQASLVTHVILIFVVVSTMLRFVLVLLPQSGLVFQPLLVLFSGASEEK